MTSFVRMGWQFAYFFTAVMALTAPVGFLAGRITIDQALLTEILATVWSLRIRTALADHARLRG